MASRREDDIGGGKITTTDIDRLKAYLDAEVVTISGLQQDTFEYLIKTYGKQLKAIRFSKINLLKLSHCLEHCRNSNMYIFCQSETSVPLEYDRKHL